MSDSPATELAILGTLNIEPMSGYALRSAIQTVLGQFWNESFGQIYPALATLEQRGLIARQSGSRPNASVFAPTDEGRAHLRQLLTLEIPDRPPRLGRLLRLYFGHIAGIEHNLAIIDTIRVEAELALEGYAAIHHELATEPTHAEDVPYWTLTVSYGEHLAKARRAWAIESTAKLTATLTNTLDTNQQQTRKRTDKANNHAT
jgi:DNA-binding PadR family transcriptional regulator